MHRIANAAGICLLAVWGVVTPLQGGAIRTVTLAHTLAANDDGSTDAVNLNIGGEGGINFFGQSFAQIYVNNNGNLTFGSNFGTYTPNGLAEGVELPIIAPFFADVDTNPEDVGGNSGLVMYGNAVINNVNAFVANYVNVCYFAACDKHNSFQVVLYDRSDTGAGNFDIEFNYDQVQWETGDDSGGTDGLGGTSVAIGYSNGLSGNANVYYQLPGSLVPGSLIDGGPDALISNSNVGVPGRYVFTVRNGVVNPGLRITSGAPPASGTVGSPYGPFTATASGGSGSFQWSVSGVAGVTIDSGTGTLGGTPTAPGSFSLKVTVADANNLTQTTSQSYPVTIAPSSTPPPTLMITSGAPPAGGTVGVAYGPFTATASGGSGTYQWSATGVPGVTINATTGVLSGSPTTAGSDSLRITVADANNLTLTASASYGVAVIASPLTITSGAPPAGGTVGVAYGPFTATASGGSGTYQWSATGVPGVTINATTGVLSGAPTTAGSDSLRVTVADANNLSSTVSASYGVTVIAYPPLVLTSTAPPAYGAIGQAYGPFTFTGSGGSGSYQWSVSGVPGLTVNSGTGVVSGTPTVSGNLTLTVTLTNANNLVQPISHDYPVNVLAITSGTPPTDGTVGLAYGPFTVTAGGGSGSYLWSASGVPGVTIGGGTGVLSGTPVAPGSGLTLTVMVTDTTTHLSVSQNYTVNIAGAALVITTTSLPGGIQNQPYSARLAGAGGSGSYTWTIGGITGLVVNATSGAISGSPSVGGSLSLNVTMADTLNPSVTPATKAFPVVITFGSLSITSSGALGGFAPGAAVSTTFTATGGSTPYTWGATGVPATLTLDPMAGTLTGTVPVKPGNYSFPLKVTDSQTPAGSDSTTVRFSVIGFSNPSTLPTGSTSTPYSLHFIGAGGTPPYTFSSANAPGGLGVSSAGLLSGTPAKAGTFSFTVQITDATGISVQGTFSVTVGSGPQPIQVTGLALPDGTATTSYSQTLEAQAGKPPYTWTVIGGTLPVGLQLSSAGTISGTPTATGLATFTARATDSAGGFAAGVFTITIDPAPLQIISAALPNAIAGLPYGPQPINASGGFAPYTFALTQGALPAPLTFSNGQINSGVPAATGSSSFTVTVTDAVGNTASGPFALQVEPNAPDLVLSQASVTFAIATGAVTLPAAANVTVGSSVAASLGYNVLANPAAPWLDFAPNGNAPGTLVIQLDPVNAPQLGAGTYTTTLSVACLPFSCSAPPHNIAVTLTVSAPAPQLTLGANLISFSAAGNSSQTMAQPLNLQNSGGGVLTIQSVTAADSWVKFDPATIPPPSVPLSGGQTLQVNVFADTTVLSGPGYYQSTITVTTDAGLATIPVTLLIAANATMTLGPAGSQYNTVAGNAPGVPNGSFFVNVSGSSTVNWTAAILPTSPAATWLTLNTGSGQSTSASPGLVTFSVNGTAASLAAQAYYATIEVTAAGGVTDPVQDYQVVLNVAPAGNITAPNPDPQGLIFISTGAAALPPQVITVGSSSAGVSYTAKTDGSSWLAVDPASGMTSSAAGAQSNISVNTAGLGNGVYHGGVNYSIAGQVRTVNITLIVNSAAAAPAISGITGKAVPACKPTQIIPTQTGLVNNFSLPTSWPTPLEITVNDDCGNAVTNGQVVTTFSNGDPPLVLPGVGGTAGVYSGTWTPRATASQVTITAQAAAQGFKPAAVQLTGQVTRNGAPVLNPGGTLNAFVPVVGSPLAPGMIVQIYGSNLASQVMVGSTIPLTTSLNNTSVIIGGIEAPLYFVSPGQINAQVPFELKPGAQYQVIVNANGALSTPNPIQLAADAPGIAAFASGGIIAEHAADGSLVTEASPAVPGEFVVFFVSGMGSTTNPVASGQPSPGAPNLAQPTDSPKLTLNGTSIPVAFAGLTPTLVGLYQVDFQLPADTPNGDLQLVLTQSGGASNTTVLPVHN